MGEQVSEGGRGFPATCWGPRLARGPEPPLQQKDLGRMRVECYGSGLQVPCTFLLPLHEENSVT